MTKKIGNIIILEPERHQQCDQCGKIAELRPYGKGGACICFKCMKMDEEACGARYLHRMFGEPLPPGVEP